jgi:hypothetical protein
MIFPLQIDVMDHITSTRGGQTGSLHSIQEEKTLRSSNYSGTAQEMEIQIEPGFMDYTSAVHTSSSSEGG